MIHEVFGDLPATTSWRIDFGNAFCPTFAPCERKCGPAKVLESSFIFHSIGISIRYHVHRHLGTIPMHGGNCPLRRTGRSIYLLSWFGSGRKRGVEAAFVTCLRSVPVKSSGLNECWLRCNLRYRNADQSGRWKTCLTCTRNCTLSSAIPRNSSAE